MGNENMVKSCCCKLASVSKKQIMGVSGLLLFGFLIAHLLGNFTLFFGPELFNKYAHALTSNPLIYPAEMGLLAIFLLHLLMAAKVTRENIKARPVDYYMTTKTGQGANFASRTMPYTGMITFIFLIMHLVNFKFGTIYMTSYAGVEVRDLYRTVVEHFQSPVNVIVYVVAMCSMGVHLAHGFWSAFQSLGINHSKYNSFLKIMSVSMGLLIALGFSSIAIWCSIKGGIA